MFKVDIDQRLSLALVEPAFAASYLDIVFAERDYLAEWLAWPLFADSEAFFLTFINKSLHDYADGKSMTCAMVYDNTVVGNISFNSINPDLKKVEIGYWLSAHYQGQGIVTKSVSKLIDIAFEQLDMEKVQISAAVGNQPSRQVCERLGFELEGVISNAEYLNGRIVDHAIYGLKRDKWQQA
ncbi:GNAT family N-acetyltransferase [Vibrio sp.]|uniref:GNAT family N-acetyltransferase n=1 Tax=Vibrio sp. TaxID=678 RepID=UPI003D1084C3